MPDFDLISAGGSLATVPWTDPASTSPAAPSRLNPNKAHLHTYRRVHWDGTTKTITVSAIVGGVTGPLDTALGGRLFFWSWSEWSGSHPPILLPMLGQSSVVLVQLDATHLGHFLLLASRLIAAGGSYENVAIPFDVEP